MKANILLLVVIWICYCKAYLNPEPYQYMQSPTFLQDLLGTVKSSYSSSSGVKTKSFTKTSSGISHSFPNNVEYRGGCKDIPAAPMNAGIKCSIYNGCKANCIANYQFPNGETQLFITCRDGEWEIEGTEWSTIPACEPICMPPCINNGICIAPNECNCPENYSGPQCQFQNIPCLNPPPMPINSRRTCTSKSCVISCLEGHQFPDGSQVTNLMCENGLWIPTRQNWVAVPDCEPVCSPPCQNGGNCLSFNVCQCPQEYRGPQCQYRADACTSTKLQFNGGYNCSITGEYFSCALSCPEGVDFEFPPASVYTCSYDTGTFVPFPIPQCVYGHLIPVHGNNMYYNEFNSSFSFGGSFMDDNQLQRVGKFNFNSQNRFIPEMNIPKPNPPPEKLINATNIQFIQNPNSVSGEYSIVETKVPQPGMCFTWGGTHYKTFDGKVFSFESSCAHVLVRDLEDHTFSVIVRNNKECEINMEECYRIVYIYLQDKEYILKRKNGVPVFASPKKIFPVPVRLPGIRAEMSAHYFVVIIDSVGVTIKWDGQQLVQVEVKENMWNRTEGLCGRIDGNPHNDMISKSGMVPKSVVTLATSWQVDSVEDTCNSIPKEEHACHDSNDKNSEGHKAMEFCQKLLADNRFKPCQSIMDVFMLLDACRWDYCNCEDFPEKCACQTLNVYVRECAHKGVTTLTKWRDQEFCPMQCSGNRIYMPCAPPEGQEVCGDVYEKTNEDGTCEEGCYCPDGTVLHNSECIVKEKCPCRLRGKDFPPGSSVPKDCNTCTCLSGKWVCTQVACGRRCSAIGDPHYITFDGKRYDFMGQCSYYLVKHSNFSIEAENVPCSGAISQAMNLPSTVTSGLPSCTKTVTIRISGQIIKLKQNHEVSVNGQEITRIPYKIADTNIRSVSSIFLLVELPDKVEVWWDGLSRVYVDLPAVFKRQTGGLCGTFTDNQKDDFHTPEGDIEKTPEAFANKWKTAEKCNDVSEKVVTHPCEANIQNKATAEEHCSIIKSREFEDCHWYVDPEPFYQDCLYDVCACETKQLSNCLCPMISAYAQECALKGIKLDWRNNVRECGIHCSGGQKYQICGNSCTRTCSEVSLHSDCDRVCIEGCNCPEGEALDEYGECIPIGQCSCQYEGLEFRAGYKEVRPASKGLELCTCVNAQWSCQPATEEEVKKYPNAGDLKTMCDSSKNWEFTTCEPERPITCKNMHSIEQTTGSECHPGCQCKDGYVLDSHSNECIRPTECPCHHGGRSYGENAIVQSDCNTCTCNGGKWSCTERQCAAECSTWGDSHYKTFDGKMYDYQGQCDYVLAKGVLDADESFDISIQNVPCGSLGVSCSKSITIKVGHGSQMEKVTLTRESNIPVGTALKRMTIRQKGLFVIVEAAELGLVVLWDKGTRVYVKLDPRWKDKVKGLCGNYNDNENDDFQTPSGGITEVSAQLFGDSWKLQSYCPETVEITDTCEQRPDRKIWAVKKCSILKSSLFAPCHSEVSVDDYLNRCIFDTCACDQGGDCECLCTALAAYAQECNNKGVPVKWRSQELCPIQCDQRCSKYSPCISTCPLETCDNLPVQSKLSKLCTESSCIEGCQMKPCSPGHVFLNSSALDCVPINVCKPVCLKIGDTIYNEGDIIEEDECHICFCSRGQKFCKGHPCTATTEPQKDQRLKCVNGWTKWLNQDRVAGRKAKVGQKKLTDIEPLPSQLLMNQMKGAGRCSVGEMTDIECRTVKGHKDPKQMGLDVECSLERGLVCKSKEGDKPCDDFEIRVKCQCEETTSSTATIPLVTTAATVITDSPCDLTTPNQEHPTDCHLFYECVTNIFGQAELVQKSCSPGTLYNPKTYVCDWPATVIGIKPKCGEESPCPPGEKFDSCAVDCNNMCMYYKYLMKQNGFCNNYEDCVKGCVSELKEPSCPNGMLWSSNQTCVQKQDCMCVTDEGKPVKPGNVVKESDCVVCQCIDNFYTCDESACVTKETTIKFETSTPPSTNTQAFSTKYTETTSSDLEITSTVPSSTATQVFTTKSTETPPPECDGNRFINLIDGNIPLPDEAFSASSELGQYFAPKYARLNNEVTDGSGGSWIPKSSDQSQYLQIDLGIQEPVYGIILRGSPLYNNFVTSYKVTYSPDGFTFRYVTDKNDQPKIFRGPTDNKAAVKQLFPIPVEAKLIKILPITWHDTIAVRVELIGCGEESVTTEAPTTVTQIETTSLKLSTKPPPPLCTEIMGVDNGLMSDEQISVSSELYKDHDKTQLKINGISYWQPLTDSPLEWVQFDFLEPRNITGFVSKGGPNGWVTKFKVKFSDDGKVWYAILDGSRNEKEFLGNYDENSEQTNYFDLPLQARLLKLLPVMWHRKIQLRAEVLGCYKPYPTITEIPPVPKNCDLCPGVTTTENEFEICKCDQGLWWDGENCVQRSQCPCMVGHISYAVGTVFEKEDCSQCICKLGGIEHCTPKECEKCEEGLRKVVTSTCGCICQPCSEGTILCPTNNICINSTLWCNGIEDCSDDELSCTTTVTTITTVPTTEPTSVTDKVSHLTCSTPSCPPGYKLKIKRMSKAEKLHSNLSPMFSYFGRKASTKRNYRSVKGFTKKVTKSKTTINLKKPVAFKQHLKETVEESLENEEACPQFTCEPPPPKWVNGSEYHCPPAVCPAGYTPQYHQEEIKTGNLNCPRYTCQQPPLPDAVCNVTGRTFITFDNTEFKYDICEHVLVRDVEADLWEIVFRKTCTTTCSRDLVIYYDEHLFILHPDLSVEFDNYKYTVDQTKKIGSQSQSFMVSRLGDVLLFISHRYRFWIIWDKNANVKIGVAGELSRKVDGLCGYFNYRRWDDKRKPDGSLAKTTVEFGDSWGSINRPLICEAKACPIHIQNKAWEMCQKVKDGTLARCNIAIDVEAFISRCLETTCNCLQEAKNDKKREEQCRCGVLQSFVVDCMTSDSNLELSDWRMQQDCPAVCDAPLVHYDCYRRRCEPSCESLSDPNACPQLSHVCFPGCYCPPGYVRKGGDCVLPTACRDCECTVLPHLQYISYDGNNVSVSGNCDYIMTRDTTQKENGQHRFQVIVTNGPCEDNKKKTCVNKVTIFHNNHVIVITKDNENNNFKVTLNSKQIIHYGNMNDWLDVLEGITKHLLILLKDEQVEIFIYFPSLGISVKAPSMKYGGKLEGLCGDCDGDIENDMRISNGTITNNSDEFALAWLSSGQSIEKCLNKPEKECTPLPIESDPCLLLVDIEIFGKCHPLLDPMLYIEWCKEDTCDGKPQHSCEALEAYARECGQLGICVDWRNSLCPAKQCPNGFEYRPCGPECIKTCEDVKDNRQCLKKGLPTEGCFCPEGRVLLNDTCVEEKTCKVCDDEGHHPGDVWQKDKCTSCSCVDTNIKCETQTCPSVDTICDQGYSSVKLQNENNECCDKYICVAVTPSYTCAPPQKLNCAQDQDMKLITNPDGCQQFICQCKPSEDCEPVDLTSPEPGVVMKMNTSGCCPVAEKICKIEKCPSSPDCPKYYSVKNTTVPGKCCPLYDCVPPPDKCIVDLIYTNGEKGGERPRNQYEKQQILKEIGDYWNDGPCRQCQCILSSTKKSSYECTITDCPSVHGSSDIADYVLDEILVEDQCCPAIIRTACKHDNKTYGPGEKWSASKNDFCTVLKCVKANENVQKEKEIITCDTNCDLGWEYRPPKSEAKLCCGSCIPVACVVDGTVRNAGEEWTSEDFCTKYICNHVNDSLQVQSSLSNCSQISEELLKGYDYEVKKIEGECCPVHTIIGCIADGQKYKVGETWPSPDGDKCKSITCTKNSLGEIIKQETVETCNRNCSKGWEYKESNTSCCGTCEQVACVINETLKYPSEIWQEGPCKECKCVLSSSSKLAQDCTTTECPPLQDSPDYIDYVLEESIPLEDQCCSNVVRTACKHYNKTYLPGEKWPALENDFCNMMECVNTNGSILKIKQTIACSDKCDLGWEYRTPTLDSRECCGNCIPVACVVEDVVHNVDEEWTSEDFCTKYICSNINESLYVKAKVVNCPEIPDNLLEEYIYESTEQKGECCKKNSIVGCKVNGTKYKIGDTWPSSDGDKCKSFKCTINSLGEVTKQEIIEPCDKNCSKLGWEYKESDSSCCGTCEQTACVVNETLKYPGDVWKDGPCKECKCVLSSSDRLLQECSTKECPVLNDSPDYSEYFLEAVPPSEGHCCPTFVRSACKFEEKVYQPGEKWLSSENDFCNMVECVKTNGSIQKEKRTIECDKDCDMGWEYQQPKNSWQCCGSCVAVACLVDGVEHKINEKWTSDNYCIKYNCAYLNGSLQVQATELNCPTIPDELLNEYVYESENVEGECCKKQKITGCKMDNKEYKVGEIWTSPDGDKCKSYNCIKNDNGEIIKQESIESCQKNCSKGWEYKESATSCCGICEPIACVLNDTMKYANEEWKSEDGCITFRCEIFNDQLAVTRSEESCPNIDNCPPNNIYVKNCCKHCNITNGDSQVSCESKEIQPKETVGLVKVYRSSHGNCINNYELKNFKECSGRCHSSTVFNSKIGSHESKCECCQATKYEPLIVELECEDGYKYKKQIAVATECGCAGCSSNSFTKTGGTKSNRKTG